MDNSLDNVRQRMALADLQSQMREAQLQAMQARQAALQSQSAQRAAMAVNQLYQSQQAWSQRLVQQQSGITSSVLSTVAPTGNFAPPIAQQASFSQMLVGGFIGPFGNQLTGSLLFPGINYSSAFSSDRVRSEFQTELGRRLSYAGMNIRHALIPSVYARRAGIAYGSGEFYRLFERSTQASLEKFSGDYAARIFGDDMRPDSFGARIDSGIVQNTRQRLLRSFEAYNAAAGFAVSPADVRSLSEVTFRELEKATPALFFNSRGARGAFAEQFSSQGISISRELFALTNALKINTDQLSQLNQELETTGASLSRSGFSRIAFAAGSTLGFSGLDPATLARYSSASGMQMGQFGGSYAAGGLSFIGAQNQIYTSSAKRMYSREYMSRFGQASGAEQAAAIADYQLQQAAQFAQRTSSSYGVLYGRGRSFSRNPYSMVGALSAAYARDPLAGLAASQDRGIIASQQSGAELDAFETALGTSSHLGPHGNNRALQALLFYSNTGDDPVVGRERFDALMALYNQYGNNMGVMRMAQSLRSLGYGQWADDPAKVEELLSATGGKTDPLSIYSVIGGGLISGAGNIRSITTSDARNLAGYMDSLTGGTGFTDTFIRRSAPDSVLARLGFSTPENPETVVSRLGAAIASTNFSGVNYANEFSKLGTLTAEERTKLANIVSESGAKLSADSVTTALRDGTFNNYVNTNNERTELVKILIGRLLTPINSNAPARRDGQTESTALWVRPTDGSSL